MTTEITAIPVSAQAHTFSIIAAALFLNNTVALMLGPLLVDIAREFDTSVAVAGQLAAATFALSWVWYPRGPATGPRNFSYFSRFKGLGSMPVFRYGMLANLTSASASSPWWVRWPPISSTPTT
ncbi:MAG TPA: hypothetical protein DHW65_03785 [Dehalococcoidia bacterium]|nr:hypothetical protein [Dehalococcoidia bacterium]